MIPGSGRSPGEGNGSPLQYSCLENPMDGGAWWATAQGVAKSRTRLSDFTFTFIETETPGMNIWVIYQVRNSDQLNFYFKSKDTWKVR